MTSIPRRLKSIIPVEKITEVEDWWRKLSKESQTELDSIYREEQKQEGQFVSIYLCGKFVEQEKPDPKDRFWVNHFYEYIVNHELFLSEGHPIYGGVCSAQKAAREVIRNGMIPKNFKCPLLGESCQMMKILNLEERNKSLLFYVKFKLEQSPN